MSDYNHYKVWDDIIYAVRNMNATATEVWELWVSSSHILLGTLLLLDGDIKVDPRHHLSVANAMIYSYCLTGSVVIVWL